MSKRRIHIPVPRDATDPPPRRQPNPPVLKQADLACQAASHGFGDDAEQPKSDRSIPTPLHNYGTAARPLQPRLRFDRHEFAGSVGDLGTDLPLIVGMILTAGLDPASVLIVFGAFQILTGVVYGLPMPMQPLKAMAALVIAGQATAGHLYGAGLAIGVVMLALSLTGGLSWLARAIPKPVVRGIQMGSGLTLANIALHKFLPDAHLAGLVGKTPWGAQFTATYPDWTSLLLVPGYLLARHRLRDPARGSLPSEMVGGTRGDRGRPDRHGGDCRLERRRIGSRPVVAYSARSVMGRHRDRVPDAGPAAVAAVDFQFGDRDVADRG